MKFKQQLLAAALLVASTGVFAQQPYSACWFPEDVINWSPENDPDAKFNRSRIPMAVRFTEPELMKANSNQRYTGFVETATITNKMCSLTPSQGDNNFLGYQPTYWQYIQKFINWGGAGNEGIFVLPPAGTIDAAHLNGVKILGQLFFMPRTIGGRDGWIEAMLTTDASGSYPYAVKMYEIAKYFGFDGWFINKELDNGKRVGEWAKFIACFNATADAAGDTYMEIQWYDAKGKPTTEILNSHRNTSQFLEYNNTGSKSSYASELGCSAEDIFSRLYAGIECVQSGLTGYGSALSSVHSGSVALFCPEQHTYKVKTDPMWEAGTVSGQAAYDAQAEAFANENLTWTNSVGNPAITSGEWKGVSGYVLERSAINAMPFASSFAVGNGKHRFVKGEKLNTQDWYSTSVQSILPTWRYWVDLKVDIDWDDAFNFGNSLKVSGASATADHLWRLYKTMIPVTDGGKVTVAFKGTAPELKLSTASSVDPDVTLAASSTSTVNGWTVAEYDLASLKGKTIYMIALNLKGGAANSNYQFKLGHLAVLPASFNPAVPSVNDFTCSGVATTDNTDLRLTWSYDYNNDFDHFDIYLTNAGGRRLVGQTRGEGFYLPRFDRVGTEKNVKVELVAVMKDGSAHSVKTADAAFHTPAAPVIYVNALNSYAKVGDRVVLTANGTDNPTSFSWTLPAGVKLVEGKLSDATITVEALAEGNQEVSVTVGNSAGTSTFRGTAFEVFSATAYKEVHNVAVGKAIADRSRAVTGEASFLIDGEVKPATKDNCWSDISTNPFVTVDLKTPHTIYGFNIYDNHSAYKTGEDNIANYRIFVSDDNVNWTKVVDRTDVGDENIHSTGIAPVVARYVKLQPYADKRFTCRLFEFEIIGRDNSQIVVEAPHTLNLEPKTTSEVTVNYDMKGEQKAANFALQLTCESPYLTFSDPKDDGKGHFTFNVTTAKKIGKAELSVSLVNGDAKRQTFVEVIIDSEKATNGLAGTQAEMRKYNADYVTGASFSSQTTGNLTDGNTTAEGLTEDMYEDPCTSRNDLWAVFTNPRLFSLGKVKVYIPNNNKGLSANDKEGIVNNNISIRTSKDGHNWTIVESFENLGETSELTCYFPDMEPFTYLAVVCDVNTYFYPSLAEVEAYTQLQDDGPSIAPVAIANGFTTDVIAEAAPIKQYAKLDFAYGCFYTSNVNPTGAISSPDSRIVLSSTGTMYELGRYDAPNALYVSQKNTDYTLEFEEPVNAQKLYLLATNSSTYREIDAVITYEDGTTSKEFTFEVPRADNKTADALWGLKVYESDTQLSTTTYGFSEVVLDADAEKAATAITFSCTKNPTFWVIGVSALADWSGSKMKVSADVKALALAPKGSGVITVSYDLKGEAREANFALKATSNNPGVKVGEITENKDAASFTVPVQATVAQGTAEIEFELVNGENSKTCKVTVVVETPSVFAGWTADIIAEATPSNNYVTGSYDGEGWAFYSADVKPEGAIADITRIVTTKSGNTFKLEPFDKPNAAVLEQYSPVVLTKNKAAQCEHINVLAFTDRNAEVEVVLNYADGTQSEPITAELTNCIGKEDIAAAYGFGAIFTEEDSWSSDLDEFDTDFNIGFCEFAIEPDAEKQLASISFENQTRRANALILSIDAKEVKHDMLMNVETPAVTVTADAAGEILVKYDLNGNEREANFGLKATASGDAIAIGAITEDAAASTFAIAVSAKEEYGYADIAIELVNGEDILTSSARVVIETPAEFEGWNADVIAEATPVAQNAQAFHAEGWALYSADVKAEGAIADASRVVETANGTVFHLQPFDKENALVIEAGKPAELSMIEPQQCEELLVLAFAHADVDLDIIVTYTDGTTSEAMAHTVLNPTEDTAAKHGLGAVKDGETAHEFAADFNRGLYEFAIAPDHDKHVKNISFQSNTAAAKALVLAMAWKERVEGISDATAVRQIEAIYNLHGMKVANPSAGIYVVRYTDGTTRKIAVK